MTDDAKRIELENHCRALANVLAAEIGKRYPQAKERVGFMLLMFNFGPRGSLAYMSNARRDDVCQTMCELLAREYGGNKLAEVLARGISAFHAVTHTSREASPAVLRAIANRLHQVADDLEADDAQ